MNSDSETCHDRKIKKNLDKSYENYMEIAKQCLEKDESWETRCAAQG